MTNIFIVTLLFINYFTLKAQVAIGKTSITNSSVLLEFGAESRGIILPSVTTIPNPVGGTFIMNVSNKSVQVNENNSWTNLTTSGQGINHSFANQGTERGNGAIIGATTSTKSGVLVLESTTRAMVLPKTTNPHTTLRNAISGTLIYDSTSSTMAIYDGSNWHYWK